MHDLTAYVERKGLGSGGFADVVEALHLTTGRIVALKKSRTHAECVARTKREIEVQCVLRHANVMPIDDWANDGSWFVMPRARGDLGAIRDVRAIRGAELLRLVEDIAAALACAHRRGLIHRDVKPPNILFLDDRWVLGDWGFVRVPSGQPRSNLTKTGVGTEGFTAPEVYRDGSTATPAADIYSLGRVVAWLESGIAPEPNRPSVIDESSPWAEFVRNTTANDPAERPASVHDALNLLGPVFATFASVPPELPEASAASASDVRQAAVDALKSLLQDPSRRIQLEELVDRETELSFEKLAPAHFPEHAVSTGEDLATRLARYEDVCATVMELLLVGCAYGSEQQSEIWTRTIRRFGHPAGDPGGFTAMLKLRYFPTTLLMYAGGLAAVAREQWGNLAALTVRPRLARGDDDNEGAAVLRAAAHAVIPTDHARTLPGCEARYTPISDWLFDRMRARLRPLLRIDADYDRAFNRFEYIVAMAFNAERGDQWVPLGRFGWKDARFGSAASRTTGAAIRAEVEALGNSWGPIRAGMFKDSDHALASLHVVQGVVKQLNWF